MPGCWPSCPAGLTKQLIGYTGLCPRVIQSGEGLAWPRAKNGPKYLRWALYQPSDRPSRLIGYQIRSRTIVNDGDPAPADRVNGSP